MDDIENQKYTTKRDSVRSRSDKMNEDLRLSQKSLNYDQNEESEPKETKEKEGGDEEMEPLVPY